MSGTGFRSRRVARSQDTTLACEVHHNVNLRVRRHHDRAAYREDGRAAAGSRAFRPCPQERGGQLARSEVRRQEVVAGYPRLGADRPECGALDRRMTGQRERGAGPVGVVADHGDMVAFSDEPKAQSPQSGHDPRPGRISGESWAHPARVVSATKASSTADSGSRASVPKASIWNAIADLTSARAFS